MTDEQRIQLKELRGMNDPQFSMSDANARDIELLRASVSSILGKIGEITSLLKRIDRVDGIQKSVESTNEAIARLEKSHGQIAGDVYAKLEKRIPDIDSLLKKHRSETSQIIEELQKDMKISYSKMGGGTMPRFHKIETSVLVSALVYTVNNNPDWVESDGQIMVSKATDANNYGYTITGSAPLFTLTFVNPPSQPPHSFYA